MGHPHTSIRDWEWAYLYIEHSYSHFVENLYVHKTKTLDVKPVKRKCGRPPKPKPEIPISKTRTPTAAKTPTI